MANKNAYKLEVAIGNFKQTKPIVLEAIADAGVSFFKRNFKKQGQLSGGFKAWKKRKFEFPGKTRATLVDRGKLRDNIKKRSTNKSAIIYNDMPYAELQNEGGTIPVTIKMRKFFWAKYYETKGSGKTPSPTSLIWRNLALTKKTSFKIEERPFIYHSEEMNKELDKIIDHWIKTKVIQ